MTNEKDLNQLIKSMTPTLNEGEYVFVTVDDITTIDRQDTLGEFKEKEGTTIILRQEKADELQLKYGFIASWITLMVHSSLDAVGFTAVFSRALTNHGISCNVIAGFYHDHIFVNQNDADKAMEVLEALSKGEI
jgi:hypothetical protein